MHGWNAFVAVACALQGIAVLVLGVTKLVPVSVSFLARDPLQSQAAGHDVLAAASHHVLDMNLAYLVAAALFVVALAYGLMAWTARERYEAELARGINQLRWAASGLAGGLLLVIIGLLVGVQDAATLLMLFGFALVGAFCGLATEVYAANKAKLNWLAYWAAALAGLVVLVVTGWYLVADSLYGASAAGSTWGVFISLNVLVLAFFINLFLQQRKVGKWARYVHSERVYTALIFITVSAFAWQVYAGYLR